MRQIWPNQMGEDRDDNKGGHWEIQYGEPDKARYFPLGHVTMPTLYGEGPTPEAAMSNARSIENQTYKD